MTPEERLAKAAELELQMAQDAKALLAAIPDRPETDFHKGIARHPWLLSGMVGLLLTVSGGLYGRVSGSDERERAKILKAIEDQGKWNEWMAGRVTVVETGLARYGDDVTRALLIIEDMRKDQLNTLRAAADARGDDRMVARLDKKLKALNEGRAGGQ